MPEPVILTIGPVRAGHLKTAGVYQKPSGRQKQKRIHVGKKMNK
jgi:hypothetical protein